MPSKRKFRGGESHEAEVLTRDRVRAVLESRGIRVMADDRVANGQTIVADLPGGGRVKMRVRLSWRTGGERGTRAYSAVQLKSEVRGGDREAILRRKFDGERARDFTHTLLVQREEARIVRLAMVPITEILSIWLEQHAVYRDLIARGLNGRRRANPAENGHSPSLWLKDDRPPGNGAAAAAVLWEHLGVVDVTALPRVDSRKGGGGFGTAAENRLVEEAAIAAVRQRYEDEGWDVRSVERECCGFDLECVRRGEVAHVEVKGVRGTEQAFLITRGEVEQARIDPVFVLVVVTEALSDAPVQTLYSGEEFIERFDLTIVQYRAKLTNQ